MNHRCRILVVEDEPDAAVAYGRFLKAEGHYVVPVTSAEAGIEAVKKEEFDVLLVDQKLPGMKGVDFVRAVRAAEIRAGVVMMTAFGAEKVDHDADGLSVWAVLAKPFTPEELSEKVKSACQYSHLPEKLEDLICEEYDKEATRLRRLKRYMNDETDIFPKMTGGGTR